MREKALRSLTAALFLVSMAVAAAAIVPNPVLVLTGTEPYAANGKEFIRYNYDIFNAESFPAELWTPAPQLPPCGSNTRAARSWIDLYDQSGRRLYGFCGLGPTNFRHIWFALEKGVLPPSWIYIEINDRQTNTKYKSNLAETTL
jgi:hypothetical protein